MSLYSCLVTRCWRFPRRVGRPTSSFSVLRAEDSFWGEFSFPVFWAEDSFLGECSFPVFWVEDPFLGEMFSFPLFFFVLPFFFFFRGVLLVCTATSLVIGLWGRGSLGLIRCEIQLHQPPREDRDLQMRDLFICLTEALAAFSTKSSFATVARFSVERHLSFYAFPTCLLSGRHFFQHSKSTLIKRNML